MTSGRIAVLVVAVVLVAILSGAGMLNPVATDIAEAQSDPVTTVNGIQLPPPVPGLNYTPVEIGPAGLVDSLVTPATPTVADIPGDAWTVLDPPEPDGALTTVLGGADVAVSSVGGSYEVDAPKKRTARKK